MSGHEVADLPADVEAEASALAIPEEVAVAALGRAHATWPALSLPSSVFLRYLAERLLAGGLHEQSIARLASEDLYLACAVLENVPGALAAFEHSYLSPLIAAARRVGLSMSDAEEVVQQMRERLLIGADARLRQYSGQGPLRSWLLVCMLREARAYLARLRRSVSIEAAGIDELFISGLAAAHIKAELRGAFKEAFRSAFDSLSSRERTLLRYQLLDDLAVHEIARIYRVHRVTVSRWLLDLRTRLEEETRAALKRTLRLSAEELESHLRALRSGIELSLTRWLRNERAEHGGR